MTTLTDVSSPTLATHAKRCISTVTAPPASTAHATHAARAVALSTTLRQLLRFGLVGILNTAIDVLALNLLVWLFDLRTTPTLLLANAAAYALGAVNSFAFNKRWTFGSRDTSTPSEVVRFVFTTLAGIGVNDLLLWLLSNALLPLLGPTQLWANAAKVGAIGGTVLLSYLGMRLWVFSKRMPTTSAVSSPSPSSAVAASRPTQPVWLRKQDRRITLNKVLAHYSLSVVLPAYNEEQAIEATVADVVTTLDEWGADFEVLVVDDGSADRTGELVAAYAARDPRICLVTHATNRGYGAALKSGFAAATRDLTMFMDADGQFSIHDLALLLVQIDSFDAVLGYRVHRQDSWMRLVNAWGWKILVFIALGVRVRDLDCAFKLIRTEILQTYPLETSSALINAELLYTLHRTGATYTQVGVRHLPRRAGRATGANPQVIARALRDLAINAWRWRRCTFPPLHPSTR